MHTRRGGNLHMDLHWELRWSMVLCSCVSLHLKRSMLRDSEPSASVTGDFVWNLCSCYLHILSAPCAGIIIPHMNLLLCEIIPFLRGRFLYMLSNFPCNSAGLWLDNYTTRINFNSCMHHCFSFTVEPLNADQTLHDRLSLLYQSTSEESLRDHTFPYWTKGQENECMELLLIILIYTHCQLHVH